jgi:hypothetical protein
MRMSKFLKALSKKELFVPHFERFIGQNDIIVPAIDSYKEKDDHFHPSGDCTPCERYLFAKFSGDLPRQIIDSVSKRNFMVGHFWHGWMQAIAVESGMADPSTIEEKYKYTAPEGWTVVGSMDISRAYAPGHDEPYLIDFKTMNSRVFTSDPPPSTYDKWVCQMNVYMDLLHRFNPDKNNPVKTVVIGIQKDTPHGFREFIIDYDPQLVERIYDKWSRVWEALGNDSPPECDCPLGKCPAGGLYV